MEGTESPLGVIDKIYVLDKDGLVVAYDPFIGMLEKAESKMKFNGVINYIRIYVETTKHGTWLYELRF